MRQGEDARDESGGRCPLRNEGAPAISGHLPGAIFTVSGAANR